MPNYKYKAIDKDGKTEVGSYTAQTESQVYLHLRSLSLTPFYVKEEKISNINDLQFFNTKPKAKDLSMMCQQFCALLRAGVTVVEALDLLIEQTKNNVLKNGLKLALKKIREGETLASAMALSPKAFDPTLVSLVKAGEESGSLDTSLERMGTRYKKDAELKAAIKKATTYPIVVLCISFVVVFFMMLFIIPEFMEMFTDLDLEMPALTLFVMHLSNFLVDHVAIVLAVIAVVIVAIILFLKSKTGKHLTSFLAIKLPIVKNFSTKRAAAQFARTLSTLLTSGMPVIDALGIIEDTMQNYYFKEAVHEIRESVAVGRSISSKMVEFPIFPSMLVHMISIGEDTGEMSSMLERTADYYDLEVATATDSLTSALQPVTIVLLAGVVLVLAITILGPMVSMYDQLQELI